MDIERIENFVKPGIRNNTPVNIHFKGRPPVTGFFIRAKDYEELKAKNFWRVVHASQIQNWSTTNDINVARIFNGASFTSLTVSRS